MGVKRKNGEEVSVYLPYETIRQIDKRKGEYLSRSRFVYWALNEFLKGNDISNGIANMIEKRAPQGATVSSPTPSEEVVGSNKELTPSSSSHKEALVSHVG